MATKTKTKAKPKKKTDGLEGTSFQPIMLVRIYRYAKIGMSENAICEAIPCSTRTWQLWKKRFPAIPEAVQMGKTDTQDGGNWHKFIYDRLPDDIRVIWDQIESWDELPNGMTKIEALLADHGKSVRQQLFIYALIHTNFSASRAMAKVCIDKDTLDYWITNDPYFAKLVEEIQWHKGNFYEESLVGLVAGHDTAATIFANKTFNAKRGYGAKSEVSVNHSGQIDHNLLDLAELELSPEVRVAILEAIRQREEKLKLEKARPLIPIEARVHDDFLEEIAHPELFIDAKE